MRTDEIMRGDMLYYRGRFNAFPFKVEQVTKKKIGYHVEPEENRMHYLRLSEVFPIRLTEEIIQRNFKVNEPYQEQFGTDSQIYYVLPTPKFFSGVWNFVWVKGDNANYLMIEDDPIIKIKYFHELQHLFKLCNISKEIVL